jgi:hypothetical protein
MGDGRMRRRTLFLLLQAAVPRKRPTLSTFPYSRRAHVLQRQLPFQPNWRCASGEAGSCSVRSTPLPRRRYSHAAPRRRSIAFAVAFLLLIPLAFFRWSRPATRTFVLFTPTTVAHVRVATFIIRAILSKGNYADGLFIAEQVRLFPSLLDCLLSHSPLLLA